MYTTGARLMLLRKDTHQGGLSATVIACQRGLFSGIDNQIEVGKQNFLIGMGIAKVFIMILINLLCLG